MATKVKVETFQVSSGSKQNHQKPPPPQKKIHMQCRSWSYTCTCYVYVRTSPKTIQRCLLVSLYDSSLAMPATGAHILPVIRL